MKTSTIPTADGAKPWRSRGARLLRGCVWGCAGSLLLLLGLAGIVLMLLHKVPRKYPVVTDPIPPPAIGPGRPGLPGFDSPYLGHTGSWDGKGGAMLGASKVPDLEIERGMGLKWTFMPVYWKALEPDGPVDLTKGTPPAWVELDGFVAAAQARGLNILMQAPVVGGNAGGPPRWAGLRQPGKSAPGDMAAVAAFAGKLTARYRPGGTFSTSQGWGDRYGVRAWELDNEPESYLTSWKGQAGDYAEFVTEVAARIKQADPVAVVLAPALAGGGDGLSWLEETIEAKRLAGSPSFRQRGMPYSIGKAVDVVSFHCYEGLETAFSSQDRTVEVDFLEVRRRFESGEQQPEPFGYGRKTDYWHTEGNYDFLGVMSARRRAAWRVQFMTRGFAAGIRKLAVMDPSVPEQLAVKTYIRTLPDPFPIGPATAELRVPRGRAVAYKHTDRTGPETGQVWVVWAVAGAGSAAVEIPTQRTMVRVLGVDGSSQTVPAANGRVWVELGGDAKMAPPVLVVDRAKPE